MQLPTCQWRRQPIGADRHVCISPRVRCNASGIADADCFTCRHRDHARDGPRRRECKHFGEFADAKPLLIRGRVDGARVVAAVHRCALHEFCSPNTAHTELACCLDCPDHEDDWTREAAGDVRHLTFFLYPAGPWWKWHIARLCRALPLFNGVRVVAVALDAAAATLEEVKAEFGSERVDFLPVKNDPLLKECVAHQLLVERVSAYRGDGDVTFYGHGKGAGSHTYGEGVRLWTESMYDALLDYWPAVRRQLRDHAAVGVWRRVMSPVTVGRSSWHFSGTFRWVRNRDLFRRDWRSIDPTFYGSETYVGKHFRYDEAACLYGDFAYAGVGLYLKQTWDEWAAAAAAEWYAAHAHERTTPMLSTVILTAHRQPNLVHDAIRSVLAQTSPAWELVIMDSGPLSTAGAFLRYGLQARVRVHVTGERPEDSLLRCGQSFAVNEAFRRGLVRGELVHVLSDDDLLAPHCVAAFQAHAAANPEQAAWYGTAQVHRLTPAGHVEKLDGLAHRPGPGPHRNLRTHVDGMQVCVRRAAWLDWPEAVELGGMADGYWLDALADARGVWPAPVLAGIHRRTPLSRWTQ